MFKLAVTVVLLAHGLIHLMGFAKAFGLAELPQLTQPISRPWGLTWGLCALVIVAAGGARAANVRWWWSLAAPALVGSQVTVVAFWGDAKFGTIANAVLIVPVVMAFGTWRFAVRAEADVSQLAARSPAGAAVVVEARDIAALPPAVAAWLHRVGVVGRPRAQTVHLRQRGALQTAPGETWLPFRAEQWVIVPHPAFLWLAHVDARFGLTMAARDRYLDGKGSMRIELLSLIPVVNEQGATIDQGALVRFLAETMWYPSAALAPYLHWAGIGAHTARATMRYGDIEAEGVFRFDDNNDVVAFEARRYRDHRLENWTIHNDTSSFRAFEGVRIPTRSTITWDGAGEPWTWLRIEVVSLERNPVSTR